jgi:hypothetical protein
MNNLLIKASKDNITVEINNKEYSSVEMNFFHHFYALSMFIGKYDFTVFNCMDNQIQYDEVDGPFTQILRIQASEHGELLLFCRTYDYNHKTSVTYRSNNYNHDSWMLLELLL